MHRCSKHWNIMQFTTKFPEISGNLVVKSNLPPRSGSSLEAVEPHPWKGAIKFFKSFFHISDLRFLAPSSIECAFYFYLIPGGCLKWRKTKEKATGNKVVSGYIFGYADIFSSTFLQPVNSRKNSILNWLMKLNFFMCVNSFLIFWNILERFSILSAYSS